MMTELYLAAEQAVHTPQVEALNDKLFGPDRHTKTVARFRDGVDPIASLCLVAINRADQRVKGSIRYWPVKVGSTELIMLGPVCVDTGWQGKGIAGALISTSLEIAALHGHSGVILKCNSEDKFAVYAKHGFQL
jgi:predicted N-acetyltransferase YhbS